MASLTEYAQLSARVYYASDNNRTVIPNGWTELAWYPDFASSGFSAGAYRNNTTGEVVVAYTGTNDLSLDWLAGNLPAATGLAFSPQVFQAMLFYEQIKARPDVDPGKISFTGHSLGGGLASLMAVFFNKPAQVLAEAPFQNTAINPLRVAELRDQLLLAGISDPDFNSYTVFDFLNRQPNVGHSYLEGEVLRSLPFPEIAGPTGLPIGVGQTAASSTTLHSILLHTAAIHSFRNANGEFLQALRKMPNFVPLLFDTTLYAADRRSTSKTDLLSMILRHQYGDGASIVADGMLDGFGRDALKLSNGGLIKNATGLEDALIKAMLQGYYRLENDRFTQDLLTSVSGGFYLDVNRIATDASSVISYSNIAAALFTYYGSTVPVATHLNATDRWTFQSGVTPLIANADAGHNDFIAGDMGSDQLGGGDGNDVLLGGNGDDVLNGGVGNDTLHGGPGTDTYIYRPGDGNDTIVDTDAQGSIRYGTTGQEQVLTLGLHQSTDPAGQYQSPDGTIAYQMTGTDLTITTPTGTITVRNYNPNNNDLGLHLRDLPDTPAAFGATYTAAEPTDDDLGLRDRPDGTIESRDLLVLSGDGSDRVLTGTGNDHIVLGVAVPDARDRDYDAGFGGAGDDLIEGGASGDILVGEAGNDRLYAGFETDLPTAFLPGQTPTNDRDWLAGGDGDDLLVGSAGANGLSGGGGKDVLIGGAGDDNLLGDADYYSLETYTADLALRPAWDYTDDPTTGLRTFRNVAAGLGTDPGGDDILYGGDGNDRIWGEWGNDTLHGDDGNDVLQGDSMDVPPEQQGNDILLGGAGEDILVGGGGVDHLFGGAGNDTLTGDASNLPMAYHGNDDLQGGDGDDIIDGNGGNDVLHGEAGNDLLDGSDGDDLLFGDDGNDTLDGGSGNDELYAGAGTNTLTGGLGNDTLLGGTGTDILDGGDGDDLIDGNGGNDTVILSLGTDTYRNITGDNLYRIPATLPNGFALTLADDGGTDRLQFERAVLNTPPELGPKYITPVLETLVQQGNDLVLNVFLRADIARPDVRGTVRISDYFGIGEIETIDLAGSQELHTEATASRIPGTYIQHYLNAPLYERFNPTQTYTGVFSALVSGTDGPDTLTGLGPVAETFYYGNGGDDILIGNTARDILDGGSGNDRLEGKQDYDTYYVTPADADVIFDDGRGEPYVSLDTLRVTGTLQLTDLSFQRDGNDLRIGTTRVERYFERDATQSDSDKQYPYLIERLEGNGWAVTDLPTYLSSLGLFLQSGGNTADTLTGGRYDDRLHGNGGNDSLDGAGGNDQLDGGAGDDALYGQEGGDTLIGGAGSDVLYGETFFSPTPFLDSRDTLIGGAGDDTLFGGQDGDTYVINRGDGFDSILDDAVARTGTGVPDQTDVVVFGAGITPENIRVEWNAGVWYTPELGADPVLSAGTLGIDLGNGDGVRIEDPTGGRAYGIELFRFADGRELTLSQIMVLDQSPGGIGWLSGTEGADVLQGSFAPDQLYAYGGADLLVGDARHDELYAGAGSDILVGGRGDDSLWGDTGSDVYLFNAGDGDTQYAEYISDWPSTPPAAGETDTLSLGGGIRPQDLLAYVSAEQYPDGTEYSTVSLKIATTGELLTIAWTETWFDNNGQLVTDDMRIERLQFLGNGSDAVYDFVALVNARWNALRAGYDPVSPTYIPLFTPDTQVAYDVTSQVVFAGGEHAQQYATIGTVPLTAVINIVGGTAAADTLTGTGGDDRIFGLAGNDTLNGNAGNDLLDGGTGTDTMNGGTGNDTYIVDNTGDIVTESSSTGGTDTVQSSVTWTLGSNVENLTLTGTTAINGTGNSLANVLTGNTANNTLSGSSGADTLYGLAGNDSLNGGTGADRLEGGLGDDTYTVDNIADLVIEAAGEGTDKINSSVTYTLGNDIENLTLTGTSAINGIGNTLDNILTGNSANNTLTGGTGNDTLNGGSGSDTLIGGTGNDTYVVNVATDVVTENVSEGTDTVQSSITYTLGNNVENLTLTGTATINGTGNAADNVLTGNSAANTLTGNAGNDWLDGGAGTDTMRGGTGNDTYVVSVSTDVITENTNDGTDTVQTAISYTLGANLENLTLTGSGNASGTGNTLDNVLTGNSANNTLTGNAGNDTLNGGLGTDTLNGGTGNDTYIFNRTYGLDTITDNDTTTGNQDSVQLDINPLDVVFTRATNNLHVNLHGSTDRLTVTNWYTNAGYQTEVIRAADGRTLFNTQVEQLIQAMAQFSANNGGITWDQAIDQNPTGVEAVLAGYWQAA